MRPYNWLQFYSFLKNKYHTSIPKFFSLDPCCLLSWSGLEVFKLISADIGDRRPRWCAHPRDSRCESPLWAGTWRWNGALLKLVQVCTSWLKRMPVGHQIIWHMMKGCHGSSYHYVDCWWRCAGQTLFTNILEANRGP